MDQKRGTEEQKRETDEEKVKKTEIRRTKNKEQEKKKAGLSQKTNQVFKDLPPKLPALLYARDVYKRASKHGLVDKGQWSEAEVGKNLESLDESIAGQALFEIVASCRKKGIDPESALRRFASKQVKILE